ncbi:MAG: 2-oxoglutarate dehydrogenase, E2 component, dihydrolipoamide succinyltransferase [Jatrophihabitans sp.]|nr:MAG: 2-oxoglutarate dehydrogenase, E2 component, dihydrolipoamide succinyltransferase [Jatrophihabitans sp.]
MPTSVTMPRLGESVTEGTVTRWLKQEGDHVDADEPLLEVSTDKVDTEVPSPASGTLLSIKVGEDETVEVGVELAVIGETGEASGGAPAQVSAAPPAPVAPPEPVAPPAAVAPPEPVAPQFAPAPQPVAPQFAPAPQPVAPQFAPAPQPVAPQFAPAPQPAPQPDAQPVPAPQRPDDESGRHSQSPQQGPAPTAGDEDDEVAGTYVTPLVRKLAGEHGVDLAAVQGTGIGGRIRKSDVLAAVEQSRREAEERAAVAAAPSAPSAAAAPAPSVAASLRGRTEPMSRMRQVIAARMVESLQTSAQLTTVVEVDVTKIARLRDQAKAGFEAREGVKLTFLPFFAVATIEALKAHPGVNASVNMDDKTITYHSAAHLGIAVDTDRGLLVPVIHDADDLNLAGLARKIADLADRTRTNRITPDELGGGTFTVTNTGSRGALFDTPIINQPQVAILGTGAVIKRAAVVTDDEFGETIAVRSMCYLALTYDHRVVDGADAARFLGTVKDRLEGGRFERALGLA